MRLDPVRAAYLASVIVAVAAVAALGRPLAEALLIMFVGWVGGVLFAKARL